MLVLVLVCHADPLPLLLPPPPPPSCLHSRVKRLCQPVQCQTLAVNIMLDVDRATGAAKRRRERRLRSWWRHEAQSVQAAVVSALHHSRDVVPAKNVVLRGQKKTTEKGEAGLETHSGLRAPTPLPPGMRPASLAEPPGAQERVQRHTVDQIVDAVSGLPTLDVPVPQMADQLLALLMALDSIVPEQVIKVPKTSTPSRCPRTVLSVPWTVEQLVQMLKATACLSRLVPNAPNSGGRTPGSKLPASPPSLPRPDGGGQNWPCACAHGPKKKLHEPTIAMMSSSTP